MVFSNISSHTNIDVFLLTDALSAHMASKHAIVTPNFLLQLYKNVSATKKNLDLPDLDAFRSSSSEPQ